MKNNVDLPEYLPQYLRTFQIYTWTVSRCCILLSAGSKLMLDGNISGLVRGFSSVHLLVDSLATEVGEQSPEGPDNAEAFSQ